MRKIISKSAGILELSAKIIFTMLTIFLLLVSYAHAAGVSYTYDDLSRLVQESYDNGAVINYSYDSEGNRLSKEVIKTGSEITLISPNGGEHWKGGATESIRWSYAGEAGSAVKVELYKGSSLNTIIAASAPIGGNGQGGLEWKVPAKQVPGADYKVKVTSLGNAALSDISRGSITIDGPFALAVTAPESGAGWTVGGAATVKWSWTGDPPSSVRVELLKDGRLETIIAEHVPVGTAGAGLYDWIVPVGQAPGTDYQVRISTPVGGISATSKSFSIQGGFAVSDPGSCQAGHTKTINWSYKGNPGDLVKLELMKGNQVLPVIAASIPLGSGGYGSYPWPIPAAQAGGSDYRIRISSISNAAYTVTSNSFTINPSGIIVSSPKNGYEYQTGTSCNITWSYSGNPGPSVKIDLLKGGAVQANITRSYPIGLNNSGSYKWTIPLGQASGDDYKIRITSTTDSAFKNTGDSPFSIVPSTIVVNYPNGSEKLQAGTTYQLRWNTNGNPGTTAKIELVKGGAVQSVVAASVSIAEKIYNWAIPPDHPGGSNYSLRITSNENASIFDNSDNVFSIVPVGITLSDPNGWEEWQSGKSSTISWSYTGKVGAGVRIELLKADTVYSTIVSRTAAGNLGKGAFAWAVPPTLPPGNDYRIRVTSTAISSCSATSVNTFSILPTPITITSPRYGNQLRAGTSHTIGWNYTGSPGADVKIELLKGSQVHSTLASSVSVGTAGRGTHSWNIPVGLISGADYRIRVSSTSNAGFSGTTTGPFEILPAIQVTAPTYYTSINAGGAYNIRWSYTGSPGSTVRIELVKGGAIQSVITPSCSVGSGGSGSYNWAIPAGQPGGSDYKVQVTSTSNGACSDISDNAFTIVPSAITVRYPYDYDLEAGRNCTITWGYTGSPGSLVKIELLKGSALKAVLSPSQSIGSSGSGSFNWAIPVDLEGGEDYKIRITSNSNAAFNGTSESSFTIIPTSINLVSPYSGYSYQAGNDCQISWRYKGSPGSNVKIELLAWSAVKLVISPSCSIGSYGSGSYTWRIPGTLPGGNYRVRVTSTPNNSWQGLNDSPITIKPSAIAVTSPSSSSNQAGTTCSINWSYWGDPGSSVNISLYKKDAYQYTIAESVSIGSSGWGSYSWTIPARLASGDDYRVAVTSRSSSVFRGMSSNPFRVLASKLWLTSPSGGNSFRQGSTQRICWGNTGAPGEFIKIDLLRGGITKSVIAAETPIESYGSGCYDWVIPTTLPLGSTYRVRVTGTTDAGYTDMNDSDFSIVAP